MPQYAKVHEIIELLVIGQGNTVYVDVHMHDGQTLSPEEIVKYLDIGNFSVVSH